MPAHRSALQFPKHNILTSTYTPYPLLERQDFRRLILNYLVFVCGYLKKRMSVIGLLCKLETSPAKYTRWERMNEIFIHKAVNRECNRALLSEKPCFWSPIAVAYHYRSYSWVLIIIIIKIISFFYLNKNFLLFFLIQQRPQNCFFH